MTLTTRAQSHHINSKVQEIEFHCSESPGRTGLLRVLMGLALTLTLSPQVCLNPRELDSL